MGLTFKKYSELTSDELTHVLGLILAAKEVNPKTLPQRLSEAILIGIYKVNDSIVATATIKRPLESYKLNVFTKSKTDFKKDDFEFELGYVMVDPKHRKDSLASNLCKELCNLFLSENIFATTRLDNVAMQTILKKNNFAQTGQQYKSRNNTSSLILLVKTKK